MVVQFYLLENVKIMNQKANEEKKRGNTSNMITISMELKPCPFVDICEMYIEGGDK